jgi:polysaccharide biosynthesis protein PslG
MTKFFKLWPVACLLPAALAGQIPEPVLPQGVGVNIHFIQGHEHDLDLIAAGGFKFVRMDFDWQGTEPTPGTYHWSAYDDLTAQLRRRGLRAIYILDYAHSAYEPLVESRHAIEHTPEKHTASPRHPESIAAFARWAVAAAKHFRKQHVIWEIYNEPNGDFWKPKPDGAEYAALALATAKAVRQAEPSATIIGPAMYSFDWKFIQPFMESGVLEYIDAVSLHPYRGTNKPPETTAAGYKQLHALIDQYAPKSKQGKIPIISGEWGYASNRKGVSIDTQAEFAVRQQLFNLLNGVPLSIWYDWSNDGPDPDEKEHNFGVVNNDLTPKPAYLALQTMTRELAGYKIARRIDDYGGRDFVVLFSKPRAALKIAAWTLDKPHAVQLPVNHRAGQPEEIALQLEHMPKYVDLGDAQVK